MPFYPKDPEERKQYEQFLVDRMQKIGSSRTIPKVCEQCGQPFTAKERKAKYCENCKKCIDCGKPISINSIGRRCQSCSRQTPAAIAQRQRLHDATRKNNPAKKAESRRAISEGVKRNHPSKLHPEQWAAHIAKYRPEKVSKLEAIVAPFLPGFTPQLRVKYYAIDFADGEQKIAVEIQGCWHHSCQVCYPGSPTYKTQVLTAGNDKRKNSYLLNDGWKVIYLWEHNLRADVEGTVKKHVYNSEDV